MILSCPQELNVEVRIYNVFHKRSNLLNSALPGYFFQGFYQLGPEYNHIQRLIQCFGLGLCAEDFLGLFDFYLIQIIIFTLYGCLHCFILLYLYDIEKDTYCQDV